MMMNMLAWDARKVIASKGIRLLSIAALVGQTACASRSHSVRLASTGEDLQNVSVEIGADSYGALSVREIGPPPPEKKTGFSPAKVRVFDERDREIPILDYDILYDAYGGYKANIRVLWKEGFDARKYAIIGGELVDKEGIKRLTSDELIQAYKYSSGQVSSLDPKIKKVFPSLTPPPPPSVPRGYCGQSRNHPAEQRLLEALEEEQKSTGVYNLGKCRREYERTHPVGPLDQECLVDNVLVRFNSATVGPKSCSSDKIARVVRVANMAIRKFAAPPFLNDYWSQVPLKISVSGNASNNLGITSPCVDYITLYSGAVVDDVRAGAVIPHEIFHRIQYNNWIPSYTDKSGFVEVIMEGGAMLAEDYADDTINQYVFRSQPLHKANMYDCKVAVSLLEYATCGGCNVGYHAGLFWKYVTEQHSGVEDQFDVVPQLAQAVVNQKGYTVNAMKSLRIGARGDESFDECNGQACKTTWLGFLAANYLHRAQGADRRYRYLEEHEAVKWPDTAPLDKSHLYPLLLNNGGTCTSLLKPWSGKYFIYTPGGEDRSVLRVAWSSTGRAPLALVARVLVDQEKKVKELIDVLYEGKIPLSMPIDLQMEQSVVVIIGSRENEGDLSIRLAPK